MTEVLNHRGPDARGYFREGPVSLGHTRLSILDLSAAANQPFHSRCGRYVLIYNGEIYNYRELTERFQLDCRTHSDTEVVVELFARHGPEFVRHLMGMFAFVILDRRDGSLYMARDRIGIKPLNYYWDRQRLLFASELKSLQTQKAHLEQRLCPDAIAGFLHLGSIPTPLTSYTNTFKFPAACWARFDGRELQIVPYWSAAHTISEALCSDEEEALHQLQGHLLTAVRDHMISDVPFGTLLSGGVDSSLITALAQAQSSVPIKTFSVSFPDPRFNDGPYARRIAAHLGTDHQDFLMTDDEALRQLPEMTTLFDEPFADSSAIPTLLVAGRARQRVTTTLCGDGGDELFMGYGAYTWARRMSNPLLWFLRKPLSWLLSLGGDRHKRAAGLLNAPDRATLRQHIFSQEQYFFSRREVLDLLLDGHSRSVPEIQLPQVEARQLRSDEVQAIFDLLFYLPDDLLKKVDRASMRCSLEVRVPFLDPRVVNFALNLAPGLKNRKGVMKYPLKTLLHRYVPRHLVERPKRGFSIPLKFWMKAKKVGLESIYLDPEVVRQAGLVRPEAVADLRRRFHRDEDFLYNRLWLLIVLHKWMLER